MLTVLIYDFVQVARPHAQVAAAIASNPTALFVDTADAAYDEGEQLSVRLAPWLAHPHLGKRVAVDVGTPYWRADVLVVPIYWWASGATALFPRLDADLEVAPLGDETTQITLMGRYDPPFAALGEHADRLLLHRIAEASVRAFLRRVAAGLGAAVLAVAGI